MSGTVSKTVLVTGATGFLGRRLCAYYHEKGWSVRALARRTDLYPFTRPGIALYKGNLPDEIDAEAFRGAEVVIHAAYTTRLTSKAEAERVNEQGTLNVHALARKAGVGRFVFISSVGAHAGAESLYGRSKYALEKKMDPARDLIIRPGLIIGPGEQGSFNRMRLQVEKLGVMPIFNGGRQILQTIHIDDLCRAIDLAVEKGLTGTLVVAETAGLTLRVFLEQLASRAAKTCRFIPLPLGPTLAMLRVIEALHIPFPLTSENLLGLKQMIHMDSARDLARIGITVKTADESLRTLGVGESR